MKDSDFKRLINKIKSNSQKYNLYENLPLKLRFGVATFTEGQWQRLAKTIAEVGNIRSFECSLNDEDLSQDSWVSLLTILQTNNIDDVLIRKFPIHLYDEAKCDWLFSQFDIYKIHKFKLALINFNKGGSLDYLMHKVKNSPFKEFGLRSTSYRSFSETSLDNFFCSLSGCVNLKRLLLGNVFNLYDQEKFWQSFIANFPRNVEYVELDGTGIFELPEDTWLALCDKFRDSSVRSLSIQDSEPHYVSAERWSCFFVGICKAQMRTVDISYHSPCELENWNAFYQGLSDSFVTTLLYIDQQFSSEQQAHIAAALEENKSKLNLDSSQAENKDQVLRNKENIPLLLNLANGEKRMRELELDSEKVQATNLSRNCSNCKPSCKALLS